MGPQTIVYRPGWSGNYHFLDPNDDSQTACGIKLSYFNGSPTVETVEIDTRYTYKGMFPCSKCEGHPSKGW